jgi:hypothetical protein
MTKARDLANASTALSAVSATELAFVDGVTSAIQTQLDAKTAKSTLTTTGDIYYASAANTPARLGIGSTANVLTVSGGVPVWSAPAGGGKVLQVIHASQSNEASNTTTTFATTGLTATITPTSASSKVLVLVSQNGILKDTTAAQAVKLQLLRGSTVLSLIGDRIGWTNTAIFNNTAVSFNWLDSPATTSATTYKTEFAKFDAAGGSTVYVQNYGGTANSSVSTIILMEIGA